MKNVKIPIERYLQGMKIIKCDKPWLNAKLYALDLPSDILITSLKSYGVKELFVELDEVVAEQLKKQGAVDDVLLADSGGKDKNINTLIASDLEFLKNVFPKLLSEIKDFFSSVNSGILKKECLFNISETVKNNSLNNPLFVSNMSKYSNSYEYLHIHSLNVAFLCAALGKKLGFMDERLKNLTLAGLLHDVGKLFLDQNVLNKTGKLTDSEFNEIKKHSVLGYKYVSENFEFDKEVFFGILEHHERIDGTGYPRGLKGDKISYFGKIIAIIDSYDAITNDTVYREAMTNDAAIKVIASWKGVHFNEVLTSFFVDVFSYYSIGTPVLLDTGESGVIVDLPMSKNSEPKVLIVREQEKDVEQPYIVNIASYNTLTGKKYKNISEILPKSRLTFNPSQVLFKYFLDSYKKYE